MSRRAFVYLFGMSSSRFHQNYSGFMLERVYGIYDNNESNLKWTHLKCCFGLQSNANWMSNKQLFK